jgi:hypothetical protein
MDFMYLVGEHVISINPLSILILAWMWRLEQKVQQIVLNAARREELLNEVSHVIGDIKKVLVPQAAE